MSNKLLTSRNPSCPITYVLLYSLYLFSFTFVTTFFCITWWVSSYVLCDLIFNNFNHIGKHPFKPMCNEVKPKTAPKKGKKYFHLTGDWLQTIYIEKFTNICFISSLSFIKWLSFYHHNRLLFLISIYVFLYCLQWCSVWPSDEPIFV